MVLSICEALQMSVCPPKLWAHHQPQTLWQSDMNSVEIPSRVRIACWTTSHPPSGVLSLLRAVKAVAPCLSQGYGLPGRMWAAATMDTLGMW